MATGRVPTTANSPLTAKGDLFTYSTAPARLAVGSDGETIVADSSTSTGLRYQGSQAAGKNALINGGMDIFQRSSFATYNAYALDRWYIGSSTNVTVTQSTAKVTPNSQYMMLMTASGTQQIFAYQAIETKNAVYYAGKTVTLSGYAAGLTTTTNLNMALQYSTSTDNSVSGTWTGITASSGNPDLTLSGTVTRWSATYAIPSTAKSLRVQFVNNAANITVGQGIYLGDTQLEIGSVATDFTRAAGTIQGELAACQRYYYRFNGDGYDYFATGANRTSVRNDSTVRFPVTMRTAPSLASSSASGFMVWQPNSGTVVPATSIGGDGASQDSFGIVVDVASGLTAGNAANIRANNSVAFLEFSSEL
jgi:hypothetical protein